MIDFSFAGDVLTIKGDGIVNHSRKIFDKIIETFGIDKPVKLKLDLSSCDISFCQLLMIFKDRLTIVSYTDAFPKGVGRGGFYPLSFFGKKTHAIS